MDTKARKMTRTEIKRPEMRKGLIALFDEIDRNPTTREAFIRNPTQHITNTVMKQNLPPQQISEANRLLFSLLANDDMLKWLKAYQSKNKNVRLDKKEFARKFAEKITELADRDIIVSIISNASQGYGIPGLSDIAYQCVCNETPNKYDCACTPVSKNNTTDEMGIRPEMLRAMTEGLIARAKELKNQGALSDLGTAVR